MRGVTILGAAAVAAAVLFSSRVAHTDEEAGGGEVSPQAAEHLGTQRHALVIGIDDYADSRVPDLRSREDDARLVLSVLVDPRVGGVPESNVQSLLGAEATAAAIRKALGGLQDLPKEATVFVYFAGHGAKDGDVAYWVAQDTRKGDLQGTAVKDAEVRQLLDQVPAERVLLVMDCCHVAGLVGRQRTRKAHAEILARYHGTGYATLGAAASKEHLVEAGDLEHAVFTHHLSEGLSGKSDADENGVVVLSELAEYVDGRVGAETWKRRGLERPVADLEGVPEPSRLLLTIDQGGLAERLADDEPAQAERRRHLSKLTTLRGEDRITADQAQLGRHFLGTLPAGFEPHELEQRALFVDLVVGRLGPQHFTDALVAIRRVDRQTLVVPDDFKTIQAAIDAARAGDTVFVKAGTYDERIVFKTGLRLRGAGRERTVIRMVPGQPEILLAQDCAWGMVESLQFDGTGGKAIEDWSPDGVHLSRSSLRISECLGHSALGCGVYASGAGSWPRVRDCVFERNTQDGLCLSDTDGAEIVDCICRSNGAVGLQVRKSRGPITIRAGLFELNKQAGIGVSGGSKVTLEGNECERNGGHGVLAWDEGTSVTLVDNTCSRNEITGVYVVQGAAAVANGNVCSRNRESGFVVSGDGSRATVVGNRCLDNELAERGDLGGIVFRDGARGEVTSNTCDGNTCGILVTGHGTSALLRDNTCHKNETSGIRFSDAAPAYATGNKCDENQQGITVSNTEATLEKNTLRRNTTDGIFVCKEGVCNASENRCEGNEQTGIHATDLGTRAELLKNTCTSNGTHGILFARGAGGTADGNDCSENKTFGIAASGRGTRPTLRRNRGTDNGEAGVGKEQGAAPIVESSNTLSGNGR